MAIQPNARLAGSEHILRFQGALIAQASPGVQTVNGEVPQGAVANSRVFVKFALADMTNLSNLLRRLPPGVFDNDVPASAPRPNNGGFSGPSFPPPPLVGVPTGKTFGQNIRVRAQEVSGAPPSAPLIARIDELLPLVEIDGAPGSGLGLEQNTGVPVVQVGFYFTAAGILALDPEEGRGVPIVLQVEVPHTIIR